jgi:uncharacterized protein (TIGR00162 family)
MSEWKIKTHKKIKLKNPVLIEGLPGIGNVGKIAADLMSEQMKTKLLYSIFSHSLPNSVFVTEDNLVELPTLEIHHKRHNGKDYLFLLGDFQPMKEEDSYDFSQTIVDLMKKTGGKEIVTLGGIGFQQLKKKPKVYCTGNDKKFIESFSKVGTTNQLYGIVGPIIGVSGLLLGLSGREKIPAAALLAETVADPVHVGLIEAKQLMTVLKKKYGFDIDMKKLNKDIKDFQDQLKPILDKQQEVKELPGAVAKDTNYIG